MMRRFMAYARKKYLLLEAAKGFKDSRKKGRIRTDEIWLMCFFYLFFV